MATDGGEDLSRRPASSGSGLEPNVAAALSYVLGIVTGIIFVLLERDQFVRFHAFQSIFLTVAWIVIWIILSIVGAVLGHIPFINILAFIIGLLISFVLGLGGLILWIVLIIKAYQGSRFALPFVGPIAERYAARQLN
jgi:uncharacterized membrane protein